MQGNVTLILGVLCNPLLFVLDVKIFFVPYHRWENKERKVNNTEKVKYMMSISLFPISDSHAHSHTYLTKI